MKKPYVGEPCNGCGICCKARVCYNGAFAQGLVNELGDTVDGPCPAIVERDGKVLCGIVLNPKKYIKRSKYSADVLSRNFAKAIGSGTGCDEIGDNPEPGEEDALEDMIDSMRSQPDFQRKMEVVLKVIHGL